MSKATQCDKVLAWLLIRGELTTREAVTELNIMALPRRIKDLRNAGHNIVTRYEKSPNGAKYGVYTLVREPMFCETHPRNW